VFPPGLTELNSISGPPSKAHRKFGDGLLGLPASG
jgi:hypothetical protein